MLVAVQVVSNLAEYGNTSAASIPLVLDEAVRAGTIKQGDTVPPSLLPSCTDSLKGLLTETPPSEIYTTRTPVPVFSSMFLHSQAGVLML